MLVLAISFQCHHANTVNGRGFHGGKETNVRHRVPGGGMSLRTGEWDRGPRRLGFCQRVSPTVANYRKLRPMPGDDLLEPPCWSPLENPEPDSRRSDAPRVHGQPSELVLVRSEEMFSESRGSIAISMFEDARPSSSRSQSRGRWQPVRYTAFYILGANPPLFRKTNVGHLTKIC